MGMTVFDVFQVTNYTFQLLSQGGIKGNQVVQEYECTGVFKEREDMVVNSNLETQEADATLHVRPDESFLAVINNYMIGHGIQVNGRDYRVIGQTGGDNYDNNVREHYRLTLKREAIASAS